MSWRRGRAYSQDLRARVLAAVDGGLAVREAARLFQVSIAFIYKARIRRRRTGETTARPQRCRLEPKLAVYAAAIRAKLAAEPDLTISELRQWLKAEHGVLASHSVVWITLDRLDLTLKKRARARPSRIDRTSLRHGRLGASASPA
jgi:transposase